MLHKISEFCKKIDSIQALSNRLYNLKYNNPKTVERDAEINPIGTIIRTIIGVPDQLQLTK